ncbi:putative DeoR family transcriptional regulator [Streptomyces sp. NBRC 110611]|uniref:helix-turn-helix transcriptional regulator n=1 Tax=Streptomyces sp. NBRC 110611 TaxID=1621259 RepID=UPI0008369171|nr:WYL domain-containing protein [Streptomyces sp. NBRC 110611]GAU69755.1 putative DeoR family transcriptional regulator [Streptomyces sp. NBRC 110611]
MTSDTPARLLRLLSLLQTRRTWQGPELADRLHVTVRTVRRDVDRLRRMGYPVDSDPGHTGGYRLTSGTDLPPLLLGDDEAVAIAVALRTATASGLAGMDDTALQALAKLEQVLPARLRSRVTALQETVTSVLHPYRRTAVDPGVLAVVAAACRDHEILTFDYATRHRTPTSRRVEPHHLVTAVGLWYLVAYDTHRADWRVYRLDRLTDPTPTGHRAPPRELPAADPAAFVISRIAAAPSRYRAIATVQTSAQTVRARTRGEILGTITPIDQHSCTVDLSGDSLRRITTFLAAIDADYTLDADPDVRQHLRTLARRTANAAAD